MASIDRRPNGKWRARWREFPGGPQRTKHFARKVDAENFLTGVRHDLLAGSYIDPAKSRTTVGEFFEVWTARQPWRPTTRATTVGLLGGHFLPKFGDRPLGAVRRGDLEAWAQGLALAPSTARLAMQYVSSMFAAAVGDGLLGANPAVGAKRPKIEGAPIVPPTIEQVLRLRACAPGWFAASVTLGAGCGLRQGEAAGMTVDRVDFLRREMTVDRQLLPLAVAGRVELGAPKTNRSYRKVPLAPVVVADLARHLEQHPPSPAGLLLHVAGAPVRRQTFGKWWRATREAAGLGEVRFHDMRHFYASVLLSGGVSVAAAAEYLGHSPAMLLGTYAHLVPADHDRARSVIGAAFSAEDPLRTGEVVE